MKYILLPLRMLAMVLLTLLALIFIGLYTLIAGKNWPLRLWVRRNWCRIVAPMMGTHTKVEGTIEENVFLLVSNHRCYFDPVLTLQYTDVFPVAMAEIANWPLIGFAAKVTGIIFVKRESSNSRRRTVKAIEEALQQGFSIIIYPEGTTTGQCSTDEFKLGSFRVAAEMGIPVIPCAIDFKDTGMYWVNEDTFLGHMWREFGNLRNPAKLAFGPPLCGNDASELLRESQQWIDEKLKAFWEDWGREC